MCIYIYIHVYISLSIHTYIELFDVLLAFPTDKLKDFASQRDNAPLQGESLV